MPRNRSSPTGALALLLLLAAHAFAAEDQVGTRAFPFLRIGVGARAVGMGGAFTAVAEGADGLEWNPAGAARLDHPSLATNYMRYAGDIHAGSVAFAQPAGRRATVGLSVRFFRVGDIPRTTLENRTGEGLDSFSATDLAFKGAFAYRIGSRLYAGVSGAILTGSIDESSTFGYAADLGVCLREVVGRLLLGAAVRNVGTVSSAYVSETDPLPFRNVVGAAYPFFERRLLLAADWSWSVDWGSEIDLGAEWEVVYDFFLRAGYRSHEGDLREMSEEGGLTGLTFGIGLRKIRGYRFDYAYNAKGDLGSVSRFSFAWVFR